MRATSSAAQSAEREQPSRLTHPQASCHDDDGVGKAQSACGPVRPGPTPPRLAGCATGRQLRLCAPRRVPRRAPAAAPGSRRLGAALTPTAREGACTAQRAGGAPARTTRHGAAGPAARVGGGIGGMPRRRAQPADGVGHLVGACRRRGAPFGDWECSARGRCAGGSAHFTPIAAGTLGRRRRHRRHQRSCVTPSYSACASPTRRYAIA